MNPLKQFSTILQDNSGGMSSMRILVSLVICSVVLPKIIQSFQDPATVEWSAEEIGVILSALGAKGYQRGKEAPEPQPTES